MELSPRKAPATMDMFIEDVEDEEIDDVNLHGRPQG